jgi:hypothetical protein
VVEFVAVFVVVAAAVVDVVVGIDLQTVVVFDVVAGIGFGLPTVVVAVVDNVSSLVVAVVGAAAVIAVVVVVDCKDCTHMPVLDGKEVAQIDPGTEVR